MSLRTASATFAALLCVPSVALAQTSVEAGWALDRFDPAPAGDGTFLAEHPRYSRRIDGAVGLTFEHAFSPLTLRREYADTHTTDTRVISAMLVARLGAAVSFLDRVSVDFDLPLSLAQDGAEELLGTVIIAPGGASFGDARLGARLRLFGHSSRDPFTMHLGAWAWLPTGSRTNNTGDGSFRAEPRIIFAGAAGPMRWSLTTAVMFRREFNALNVAMGRELRITAGLSFGLWRNRVRVGPEAYVVTPLRALPDGTATAAFAAGQWGIEALLGAQVGVVRGVFLGALASMGMQQSVGVPAARVGLTLTWRSPREGEGLAP